MIELRFVNDDWEELWIEGEIAVYGHSLSSLQILEALCDYVEGEPPKVTQVYQCTYCERNLGDDWSEDDFTCSECKEIK